MADESYRLIKESTLTSIADSIRAKDGTTATIDPANFATKIGAIETSVTPTISVSSSGLITATSGNKSATKQLTTQAAKTVTPGTSTITAVSSGRYTTGAISVAGSSNLIASNIKSGTSIFGVTGSMAPGLDLDSYSEFITDTVSDMSMVNYASNDLYTPGLKVYAPALSGKTIYGYHICLLYYDSDADSLWFETSIYWNSSGVSGSSSELIADLVFDVDTSNSRWFSKRMFVPMSRTDLDDDMALYTISGNYVTFAFEPQSWAVSGIYADYYSLEECAVNVYYK